jgi:2-keto-3-deoxy-L-arabinonate dehydratase
VEENKPKALRGAVPVIPIPFDGHDEIDEEALRRLVEFSVSRGLGAVCLPAYGSEFYKLSDQERIRVVQVAVDQAAGRLQVVAQSNHGSSRVALAMARTHVENGADLISVAIPRQFALPDDDLLRYLTPIINGVDVPCLVQDFNPGGVTVDARFVTRLMAECHNFLYIKFGGGPARPQGERHPRSHPGKDRNSGRLGRALYDGINPRRDLRSYTGFGGG